MTKGKPVLKGSEGSPKASYWDVDEGIVKKVAKVARLELSEAEIKSFTVQLKGVLETFGKIDKVDTKGVEPSFHPQPLSNDWREDQAKPWKWEPLGNTKHKEGKYFKGPRIV
jgi:aspartyl-tRNA(Asn)/glutamyl-tRNA(Gln) amidotransferase subunit C